MAVDTGEGEALTPEMNGECLMASEGTRVAEVVVVVGATASAKARKRRTQLARGAVTVQA